MSQKDKWIEEYSILLENNEVKCKAETLIKAFEGILEGENIKASLTMRLKGVTSLKEKIKRNEMDVDSNLLAKNIVDVLDDMIGIRIICMKIVDEESILQTLKKNNHILLKQKIDIEDSLKRQPQSQKNGHSIYRIKGRIDQKYMFELQIKSLANLFWGEMEHLLIYKNNKYLINSTYYKNEMDSIYKELEIIDRKLTDMEGIMTCESVDYNVDEKKEMLKRIMYLNLKEQFKEVHEEEYLNNNYIFDAIANIVLVRIKPRKKNQDSNMEEEYNKIFKNAITLFLDSKKRSFSFTQFKLTEFKPIFNTEDEIQVIIFEILKNYRNGWWYMFLVLSLIAYNEEHGEYEGAQISAEVLEPYFKKSLESVEDIIKVKILARIDDNWENEDEFTILKRIITLSREKQLHSFSKNKDMRWTNEEFQSQYKGNCSYLFSFIRDNIGYNMMNEEYAEYLEYISNSVVEILRDTCIDNANIKSYIEEINSYFIKMEFPALDLDIGIMNKVTLRDVINQIKYKKEGVNHE